MDEYEQKINDAKYCPHMNGGLVQPMFTQPADEDKYNNKNVINMTATLIENSSFMPGFDPLTIDDNSNLIPNGYLRPLFDDLEKLADIQAEKEKFRTQSGLIKAMTVSWAKVC